MRDQPLHVVHLSGGITSWFAGDRVAQRVGRENVTLLFADTLVEDNDVYRFLIEGAAMIFGHAIESVDDLAAAAFALPTLGPGTDAERDAMLADRKAALETLRSRTRTRLPQLVWLAEGRSPWEVFRDERFIGNSRIDPCSKLLKRKLLDRWVVANCGEGTTRYLGLDWTEPQRQVRFAAAVPGRRVAFPAAEEPHLLKREMIVECECRGVMAPVAYEEGFPHANCGGFCIKSGQAGAARLLTKRRRYALYNEQEEARVRRELGKDVSILRDRRDGGLRTLTLAQFRERVEATGLFDVADRGACNCFEAESEAAPC